MGGHGLNLYLSKIGIRYYTYSSRLTGPLSFTLFCNYYPTQNDSKGTLTTLERWPLMKRMTCDDCCSSSKRHTYSQCKGSVTFWYGSGSSHPYL
jgi:hypothetical protein